MNGASLLRRRHERRAGVDYAVGMRLRPDDRGDTGFEGIADAKKLPALWDCIRAKASHYQKQPKASAFELVSCSPSNHVGGLGGDNCFFGQPSALDALFEVFARNSSDVYIEAKRRQLNMAKHEMSQIRVAAGFAGVHLADRAYVPGPRQQPLPTLDKPPCHIDDLRMLMLPEVLHLETSERRDPPGSKTGRSS